jgi:cell wall-associated NlpC family hydrolase
MKNSRRQNEASRAEAFLYCLAAAVALIAMDGCAASAPRFRSEPSAAADHRREADEERFATKIRAEEAKEDDRKVDIGKMRSSLEPRTGSLTRYSNLTPAGLNRDRVLLDVVSYLGVPYEHGGNSKDGVDCSGFTALVYESAAKRALPRSVEGQYRTGRAVAKKDLEFGDLVFFNTTGRVPSHVGIYIENDLFAHASVTRGVTLSSLESTYYKDRFVGARRVVGPADDAP